MPTAQEAITEALLAIRHHLHSPTFTVSEAAYLRGLVQGAHLALLRDRDGATGAEDVGAAIDIALDEVSAMLRIVGQGADARNKRRALRELQDELRRIQEKVAE
ncbi:MAG: hypothetical protein R3202_06450 [Candidatus Competibacterales bacterium]|nr:hypothetical protein [Candidatus Competibacterales bacterium]